MAWGLVYVLYMVYLYVYDMGYMVYDIHVSIGGICILYRDITVQIYMRDKYVRDFLLLYQQNFC